jgi:hypothetical protein
MKTEAEDLANVNFAQIGYFLSLLANFRYARFLILYQEIKKHH